MIRSVSPRTLRQINRLPKPNAKEAARMKELDEKFETDAKAGYFTTKAKTKSGRVGGLYGNLKVGNYGNYEQNKTGAEVTDAKVREWEELKRRGWCETVLTSQTSPPSRPASLVAILQLLKRLLTEDIESLLVDETTKAKARQQRPNKKATSSTAHRPRRTSKNTAVFSKTQPLPPPLYDLKANGELINSLSTFYDPELVTTLELDRRKQMMEISDDVQTQKFSHGQKTASHIEELRRQLEGSIGAMNRDAEKAKRDIHDAKHAGFVPEDLLPEREMKSIHFEKGIRTLEKFIGARIRRSLKQGVDKWKRGVAAAYHEDLIEAARMVQRAYRKHQARVELNERMEQRRIQRAREAEIKRLFELKQNKAALAIQQRYRAVAAKKAVERRRVQLVKILVIQRAWRIYAAKCELFVLKVEYRTEVGAATAVQKTWRAKQGRMYFRVVKKIKAMEETERKEREKVESIKSYFEDQGAAVQIQYAWRRRQLWLNLQYFLGAQRQLKAVKLQQAYRLFKANLEVKQRRAERNRRETLRLESCIHVQKSFRRFQAYQRVDRIKFGLEKASLVRKLEKVNALKPRIVTLPIMGRVPLETKGERKGKVKINPETGREFQPEPIMIDLKQQKRNLIDAKRFVDPWTWSREKRNATQVQKIFRGHCARARVTYKRQMDKLALRNWQKQRQADCATRLQAGYRGYMARKFVTLMRHTTSCVLIQKTMRGNAGRNIAALKKKERVAAICIQKQQRGYVKRIKYQEHQRVFKIQQKPCKTIQRAGRTYIAKKAVRKVRMDLRDIHEKKVIAKANEHFCWKRTRLNLLVESIYHPRAHKFNGIFQDFFRHWSGADHQNHMESAHFVKMFKDAPGLVGRPFLDSLTEKKRPFNVTDLDLMFSKKKGAEVNHITYTQFVEMLDVINATLFPNVKEKLGFKGRSSRMLEIIVDHFFKSKVGKGEEWAGREEPSDDALRCAVNRL